MRIYLSAHECKQNFQSGGLVLDLSPLSPAAFTLRTFHAETCSSALRAEQVVTFRAGSVHLLLPTQARGINLPSEFSPSL